VKGTRSYRVLEAIVYYEHNSFILESVKDTENILSRFKEV